MSKIISAHYGIPLPPLLPPRVPHLVTSGVSSFKFHYWPLERETPAQYQQYKDRSGKARPSARTLGRRMGIRAQDMSVLETNTRVFARVVEPSIKACIAWG